LVVKKFENTRHINKELVEGIVEALLCVSSNTLCPDNTGKENTLLPGRYRYSRFSPLTCTLVHSNDTSVHHCNDALVHFALMMHSGLENPRPGSTQSCRQLDPPHSTTNCFQLFPIGLGPVVDRCQSCWRRLLVGLATSARISPTGYTARR
jgi:hypothetical protein